MPFRAGDAGRRLVSRRTGPRAEADPEGAPAFPSGAQRAFDADLKRMDGGATGGTPHRAEFRPGKSHPIHAAPLDTANSFSARSERPIRQQSGRKGFEKGHPAPEKLAVL